MCGCPDARRAQDSSPVREHWESDGPAWVRDTKVMRFAQVPANRKNAGVGDTPIHFCVAHRSRLSPGTGRKNRPVGPSFAPFRGWQTPPACYPRLCAVGYYLAPFGLREPSRLRLAALRGGLRRVGLQPGERWCVIEPAEPRPSEAPASVAFGCPPPKPATAALPPADPTAPQSAPGTVPALSARRTKRWRLLHPPLP
jgi:hypothetical protein